MTETPSTGSSPAWRQWLTRFGPFLALVVVYLLFAVLRPDTFVTWGNTSIMLQQTVIIGIAALGMTMIIISGGIDLSVGSIIALCTIVVARALEAGHPPVVAGLLGVGAGAACGVVSGWFVTRLRLMPFIVTLGTMGIWRGTAKGVANEQPIYPDDTWLNDLMQLPPSGLPAGVWLLLGLSLVVAAVLRYTRFGRHLFAVGSNEATARLCGVRVERLKWLVFIVGSAFAGLAGVLQFSYLTGGDPTTAIGLELNIIAAVVIGGASLSGGQGTIAGTLAGALLMTVVANGCTKLELANWVQEIVTGAIIVAAVLLDRLRQRRN
jgi:ribose transport system permease protein